MKKISVIVTCHNLEKYLDEAIDSIKQQVSKPYEIILIHDGCKDVAKAYTGVSTVFLDKNIGVCRARDIGIKISNGDYVCFFDGDDIMPYNYLMEMEKVDADVIYPNCVLWAGWGNSGLENVWHEAPQTITWENFLKKNEVLMPSIFKRKYYEIVGGFDDTLPIFEDYEFWLKIFKTGAKFKKSNAFLIYRQRTSSRNHQNDELKREIYKKITEKFTLKGKKRSKL